jgi:hypothetical protein
MSRGALLDQAPCRFARHFAFDVGLGKSSEAWSPPEARLFEAHSTIRKVCRYLIIWSSSTESRARQSARGDILSWLRTQEAKIGHHGFLWDSMAASDESDLAALDEDDSA